MFWVVKLPVQEPPSCHLQAQVWLLLLFIAAVSHLSELAQSLLFTFHCGGFTVGLRFIYDHLFRFNEIRCCASIIKKNPAGEKGINLSCCACGGGIKRGNAPGDSRLRIRQQESAEDLPIWASCWYSC